MVPPASPHTFFHTLPSTSPGAGSFSSAPGVGSRHVPSPPGGTVASEALGSLDPRQCRSLWTPWPLASRPVLWVARDALGWVPTRICRVDVSAAVAPKPGGRLVPGTAGVCGRMPLPLKLVSRGKPPCAIRRSPAVTRGSGPPSEGRMPQPVPARPGGGRNPLRADRR